LNDYKGYFVMANQLNTSTRWLGTQSFYDYEIKNSACFDGTDQYLTREQETDDGLRSWVFSTWFKLGGRFTSFRNFLGAGTDGSNRTQIYFTDTCQLEFVNDSVSSGGAIGLASHNMVVKTKRKFKDTANWYHLVFAYDSANSTETERVRIYINGVRIPQADFETWSGIDQSTVSYIGRDNFDLHVGCRGYSAASFFDGYLAETYFFTGQAFRSNIEQYFGKFKNGTWTPKAQMSPTNGLRMTYGTDAFFLEYKNQASTGTVSDTLGADSGTGANHLTPTGTWGTGNGAVKDTPTNNFPVFNIHGQDNIESITLSKGNRRATYSAWNSDWETVMCTMMPPTSGALGGKTAMIAEFRVTGYPYSSSSQYFYLSVGIGSRNHNNELYLGDDYSGVSAFNSGRVFYNNYWDTTGYYSNGDVVTVMMNQSDVLSSTYNTILWYVNGSYIGQYINYDLNKDGYLTFGVTLRYYASVHVNFGQDSSFGGLMTKENQPDHVGIGDFHDTSAWQGGSYPISAMCSKNFQSLDGYAQSIDLRHGDKPKNHFNTLKYTGDGTSSNAITGLGFEPSLVWTKKEITSGVSQHTLWYKIGSDFKYLETSDDDAEGTNQQGVKSFDSDGFTVGSWNRVNHDTKEFYSYSWKGGSTAVTNNDGSATSTVSANKKAGFSIISYSGSADASKTIGHGLDKAPETLWIKTRTSGNTDWRIYHHKAGNGYTLKLPSGNARASSSFLNSTSPTDSVFTVSNGAEYNDNGEDYVCFAWHSVAGFSDFQSYEGAQNEFFYLEFKPALIIIKNIDATGEWYMFDNMRTGYNPNNYYLRVNQGSEQELVTDWIEMYSNGFKVNNATINTSGQTYVFWAWGEMPFMYGNAV